MKNEVKTETGIENSGDILSVLRWPDMIEFERDSQNLQNEAVDSFTSAIEEIKGMREIEGRAISKILKTFFKESFWDIYKKVDFNKEGVGIEIF